MADLKELHICITVCFRIREIASVMDEMLKASFGAGLWRENRLVVFIS
jgi:hypothetical protein